jgi:hypothetical protein
MEFSHPTVILPFSSFLSIASISALEPHEHLG